MRLALLFLLSSLILTTRGQTRQDTDSGVTDILYNVDSLCADPSLKGQTLFEWLASVDSKFKGSTSAFVNDINQYGNGGVYASQPGYFDSQTYQNSYSQFNESLAGSNRNPSTAQGRYLRGIWTFGPSYDRNSIVWFVNGHFRFITHCKARVKRERNTTRDSGYAADLGHFVNDLPQMLEDVSTVEIVTGDENFRQYIPYLRYWKGKTPTLIFVTTKKARNS